MDEFFDDDVYAKTDINKFLKARNRPRHKKKKQNND